MATASNIRRPAASERGAILIQVAIVILVLSAFAMFIVDYGMLWVSRHQAQNAADAGALAGATALALDNKTDHSNTGPAKVAAQKFALFNYVWGQAPAVVLTNDATSDVLFRSEAPAKFPASCVNDDCIRVDVYRNQTRNNPLPTIFGWLVGVNNQGVRATAIAQAAVANASDCLKPWAVLDKWNDNPGPWDYATSTFDPYTAPKDSYTPQDGTNANDTFTVDGYKGLQMTLKMGNPQNSKETFGAGWFSPIELACESQGGAACYQDAISGCAGTTYKIGDYLPVKTGNMQGPTKAGVNDLIALDPNATWDTANNEVDNSCVGSTYTCSQTGYKQSPRIVALPVIHVQEAYDAVHPDGKSTGAGNMQVKIVAILGFFVESVSAKGDVTGRLATKADLKVSDGGGVAPTAGWITAVQLVR